MDKHSDLKPEDAALLEALFSEAQSAPPAMPEAAMARIKADALSAMPKAVPELAVDPDRGAALATGSSAGSSGVGWLSALVGNLGGWPSLGGLTAALVVGFGLGVAPPEAVESLATDLLGGSAAEQIEDVIWSFDSSLLEG